MNKQYAVYIVCKMAQDLEEVGYSIPSMFAETLEGKLIDGKIAEVFEWFLTRYEEYRRLKYE